MVVISYITAIKRDLSILSPKNYPKMAFKNNIRHLRLVLDFSVFFPLKHLSMTYVETKENSTVLYIPNILPVPTNTEGWRNCMWTPNVTWPQLCLVFMVLCRITNKISHRNQLFLCLRRWIIYLFYSAPSQRSNVSF